MYGPNEARASGSVEKLTIVVVRPWKLPSNATMTASSGGHALDLVAPLAGGLDRRFHRLRAGVHRQHHLHARQLRELGAERAELVVLEGPADQRDPVQLPLRGRDQRGVAVAEVERRVGRQHVQVAAALGVGDPGALGLGDHDGQRVVVVRAVRLRPGRAGLLPMWSRYFPLAGCSPDHGRSSSVQHLGPPPALRNSDMSTGTGSKPRAASWAASAGRPGPAGSRGGRR